MMRIVLAAIDEESGAIVEQRGIAYQTGDKPDWGQLAVIITEEFAAEYERAIYGE